MDIEFMVQDAYAMTRPQWKLATGLEEAGNTFAEAVKQNYQLQASERAADQEEQDEESGAEDGDEGDGGDDDELKGRQRDEGTSSGEDGDTPGEEDQDSSDSDSDDEEEHIVVTRPEDERDPEADADFDRELAKMMSDSLDSRKFERKPMFDVPLPMKRSRDAGAIAEDNVEQQPAATPAPTMKFALLSRRGNKQQVWLLALSRLAWRVR